MSTPKAQYRLTQLIKDVRARKYRYIPREDKPIDWSSYTEAQYNEMADYLNLVREIIDEIRREIRHIDQRKVGRHPKSCFNLAKAVMVQQYFETSNRVTAGLLRVLKEKLNLTEDLTYKDIERAYENPHVILIFKLLFEKTKEPVKHLEEGFTGDGTGMPTSIKQNYANDKDDVKKVRLFDMMIFTMGTEYKLLTGVEITRGPVDENPFIVPLLKETKRQYDRINSFSYDAAAYSFDTIRYITDVGATPYIFPHKNASLKAYGCIPKKKMLLDFINHTQKWLRGYHTRSVSESRNSADKRVFPRPLLKKITCRRYFEGYARACRYNIRQLVYIHYVNGLDVRWLNNR